MFDIVDLAPYLERLTENWPPWFKTGCWTLAFFVPPIALFLVAHR